MASVSERQTTGTLHSVTQVSLRLSIKAERGCNPLQQHPHMSAKFQTGLIVGVTVFQLGVFWITDLAIQARYNFTDGLEITPKGLIWKFEGKPTLPPSKQ